MSVERVIESDIFHPESLLHKGTRAGSTVPLFNKDSGENISLLNHPPPPPHTHLCSCLAVTYFENVLLSCLVSENGGWSAWGAWSQCSKDCGLDGARIRHRMCSDPIPANRGSYCVGYSFDQEPCPLQTGCNGVAVHGGWSPWADWSPCSDPCSNGQKTRTRLFHVLSIFLTL